MRHTLIIIFAGLFAVFSSIRSFAQKDSLTILVDKHWIIVKKAEMQLLEATRNFCSITQIKLTNPKNVTGLSKKSKDYLSFLTSTKTLDSSVAAKVDSLNLYVLKPLFLLFDNIQKDKRILNQPRVKNEGKKIENELRNLGRQIHEFNYRIYEQNEIHIKFKDINL